MECTKLYCKKISSKICPFIKSFNKSNSNDYNKFQILQLSDTNDFIPQGNFEKLENYDLLYSFLSKPLVSIFINEIFRPNKTIKSFHYQKIKGIYHQIKPELDELFKRNKISYKIPTKRFIVKVISYKLDCAPSSEEDLDMYLPIFFMEWCLYPKSFIKQSKLKHVIFVNNIQFTTPFFTQYRAGCPETNETESLVLSTQERNFLYIRIVLHHEFFHYIDWIDDFSYEDEEWEKLNTPGFKYGKGGEYEREWIKLDPDVKGFINHYSTSALEEDRAEIYQYLIGCPDEALNNKDEIVQQKAKRIKNFIMNFDKKGIGNKKANFFANLMDYRTKFIYKEAVFQGNVH